MEFRQGLRVPHNVPDAPWPICKLSESLVKFERLAINNVRLKALQMCAGMKYTVKVSRRGPQSFRVFLGSSHVDVVARKLSDGGLLVQVGSSLGAS